MEANPFEREQTASEWVEMLKLDHSMGDKSDRVKVAYSYILNWVAAGRITKLVDIGSGEGYLGSIMPKTVAYVGIEPSGYLLEAARKMHRNENATYKSGSAYDSGLRPESACGVVSVMVWFHLQNLDQAAEEVVRILEPGGRFLIITANSLAKEVWESFFYNLRVEGNKLIGKFSTSLSSLEENVIYLHPNEEIANSFERVGLKVDKTEPIGIASSPEEKIFVAISGFKNNLR